jgi:hypothetical protein
MIHRLSAAIRHIDNSKKRGSAGIARPRKTEGDT